MTHICSIKVINFEGEKVDVMCYKTLIVIVQDLIKKKKTSWNAHDWGDDFKMSKKSKLSIKQLL